MVAVRVFGAKMALGTGTRLQQLNLNHDNIYIYCQANTHTHRIAHKCQTHIYIIHLYHVSLPDPFYFYTCINIYIYTCFEFR